MSASSALAPKSDLDGQVRISLEQRRTLVLNHMATGQLTRLQGLVLLGDTQGLALELANQQRTFESVRATRIAERDVAMEVARKLDKELNIGLAYIGASSDPKDAGFMQRYESAIAALPGKPTDSPGVRLAMQRGYTALAYTDPGEWKQPDFTITPELLKSLGLS